MAKKKDTSEIPSMGQEIAAVLGLFTAFFILLSLVSYSPTVPSTLFPAVSHNWGGRLGNFFAHLLLGTLGISAFWFVPLLLFFSWQFFLKRSAIDRLPGIIVGSTGIILASSSLLAACASGAYFATYPAAGTFGRESYALIAPLLGQPGFVLIYLLILLLSLMVGIRFSPYRLAVCSSGFLARCFHKISSKQRAVGEHDRTAKIDLRLTTGKQPGAAAAPPPVHEPVQIETEKEFQPLPVAKGKFVLPTIQLLNKAPLHANVEVDREHYLEVSKQLENKLRDFGVEGKVIGISPGPVVTTYEFSPAPGVKISRIVSLEDDLAMGLKVPSVRIVGSIPGKAALGVEIPNPQRQTVYIREILGHETFQKSTAPLTIGLGKDVVGQPVCTNLADMPHLLIAGATGAGKSVGINTIICSILLKASPEEVRLLMVDPKRIELSAYEDIPHLLHPVVVDPKMASRALQWAVLEMERRYALMEEKRVKNISGYNALAEEKLPLIVIIIDELADLMMVASKDVEGSVARLAQMARAAGMHLILATQRPSVDVLTGLIKANFPTRMSFKVSSKIDSRTILDASGAEHLLGKGDMLFVPPGTSTMQRIHAAYITEQEIEGIATFLKKQGLAKYDDEVMKIAAEPEAGNNDTAESEYDEKYDEAVEFVCESGQASISMVQRRLRVGYNRAARMIEMMEKEGVVGPSDGAKPREVLARPLT
ncbi:MAG: cell division protein FtsK [Deltaproteobacteria bacterium]|nr:cell division protein FtsK [Deltaproteobacteria bacterium]